MARILFTSCGVPLCERRTFHSRPSSIAVRDKLDDPTYAVWKPDRRRNIHALACKRVLRASKCTFTWAPKSRTSRSTARRSVAPM